MVQLVTLAVLGAAVAGAGEEGMWTVTVEMAMSETKLEDSWYLSTDSFVVAGTWRPMELLFVSLRLGVAEAPMVRKDGSKIAEAQVFSPAFLWGLGAGSGGEFGAQGGYWDAGLKLQHVLGDFTAANDDEYSLSDFRFGLYGNLGMTWGTFSAYGGLRLNLFSEAVYERDRSGPQPDQKSTLSQSAPLGLVVGVREKAERLTYSFELGFIDSLTVSVGAGISF